MSEEIQKNQVIELLLNHKSIRKYEDKIVPVNIVQTIIKAGPKCIQRLMDMEM